MVIYYVVIYNTDINIAGNICAAGVIKQPLSQNQIQYLAHDSSGIKNACAMGVSMNKYIELHAHIDGAITVDIAKKLAKLQNVMLEAKNDEELCSMLTVSDDCESLNDFLKCFELPLKLLQTKEGLSEAVYLILEDMRKNNVIYAELRFAPQLHTQQGMTQKMAIEAALDGIKRALIPANLILCCMRGDGNEEQNDLTVELAHKYLVKDGGVVAVDLAGAESLYPNTSYKTLFKKVSEYGIPFTIHAGEADGAGSVMEAVNMGAARIGHGVRIAGNKSVIEAVIKNNITLEMCPTSNRQTRAVQDMDDYPVMDFIKGGIKVTINTDDPAIEGTTLPQEFEYLKNSFGLTQKQVRLLCNNAIDAAFTSEQMKQKLRQTIIQQETL